MKSKRLKFAKKLVPLVLSGEKTSTWRLFDDKNLSVGDELELVNAEDDSVFAEAKITNINDKTFAEISKEDFETHETYSSKKEMIETYRGYYGDGVNNKTLVKIIRFKLE